MSQNNFLNKTGLSRFLSNLKTYITTENGNFALKNIYNNTAINLGRKANTTSGQNSVAFGSNTTASGDRSLATGYNTTASGPDSFAEGNGTTASSYSDHAEGYGTVASGGDSHAENHETTASGFYTHVEGIGTIAQRLAQHVQGAYNIVDITGADGTAKGKYLDVIGNGTGPNARSNAYTLDWDGNACFLGDVYIGAADKDHVNASKLASKAYVDGLAVDGVQATILYNGKETNTAVLSGNSQELSDSILNYKFAIVGFNVNIGGTMRTMEFTQPIFPHTDILNWCDASGTGATGAFHLCDANTGFNNGNAFRIMWGFTDATHIRNIVSNGVGSWTNAGITYVIGYKFGILPNTYATKDYVDDAIASSITNAIGGSY